MKRRALLSLGALAWPLRHARAAVGVLNVGPGRDCRTLADAARQAMPGTAIEVDAGDYRADVAVWTRDDLTLRAVGGRVRLLADGASAEGKGIWVVRAQRFAVEGFDFEGAAVDSRNGAGIRLEAGSLAVRDCRFVRNESGILTSNRADVELDIEDSEFSHNTQPDGQSHHVYAGSIRRLSVSGCYFHHAQIGHLLKSRAERNWVAYNRLTDEDEGRASYELEFANGGVAYVIGNVIQQSALSDNPHMISFGAEGYRGPDNALYLSHNTLVDDRPEGGIFARVRPGASEVRVVNNLLVAPRVGAASWNLGADAEMNNNLTLARSALGTGDADAYHPRGKSTEALRAVASGAARGISLTPSRQYVHPRHSVALRVPPRWVGALQSLPPKR